MKKTAYLFFKRVFDIVASVVAIIIFLIPWLIISVIIRIQSPGAVIYKAARVGKDGKIFTLYKFRSMRIDSGKIHIITLKKDPRIFPFGQFLRTSKLDETPQFINVLRGNMSIIGPRPEDEVNSQRIFKGEYKQILSAKPGLSSPASLYDYTHGENYPDEETYIKEFLPKKLEVELYYVQHRSAVYDLRIVWRTIVTVLQTVCGKENFKEPVEVKKNARNITVLLTDGADRQTLPLAKAFHRLGCRVAAINASKLDNGYVSRYVDDHILDKSIFNDKKAHMGVIEKSVNSGKYDIVVTTSDDTAEQLSLMKCSLEKKAHIAVAEPELFYMAYDKNQTMRVCMEHEIPCPRTYFNISKAEDLPLKDMMYPLVVKPRKSFGAIGYRKVDNESQLLEFCKKTGEEIGSYIFQEYIPQTDIQYECAMFVDQNNQIKTACVFSKNRWFPVNGGSSTCNVTVDRPDIVDSCSRLLRQIHWYGSADIDLIQDPRDGTAKIMEINPRVSGSVKIVLSAGVNIAEQILQLSLGNEVSEYLDYRKDVRLRCIHTDLLWFIKSPNRFRSHPSWFSWRHTRDQIWSWDDPLPFFTFSLQALGKYKHEIKKRS